MSASVGKRVIRDAMSCYDAATCLRAAREERSDEEIVVTCRASDMPRLPPRLQTRIRRRCALVASNAIRARCLLASTLRGGRELSHVGDVIVSMFVTRRMLCHNMMRNISGDDEVTPAVVAPFTRARRYVAILICAALPIRCSGIGRLQSVMPLRELYLSPRSSRLWRARLPLLPYAAEE